MESVPVLYDGWGEADYRKEIERLREALDMVASPLEINGDDHNGAVNVARAALEGKDDAD